MYTNSKRGSLRHWTPYFQKEGKFSRERSSTESFMNFTKPGRCRDDQNGENETFRSCEMIFMDFWSNFVCIS